MGILAGGILLLTGLIFLAVGGIPLLSSGGDLSSMNPVFPIFAGVGGLLTLIGGLMVVTGLANARRRRAKAMMIYERGVATEGTVTYVDRNYRILINNAPIYSIVEFKFKDGMGVEHVSRKDNVQTELVIRNQIQVGSVVQVKYLPEDPAQNILMIPDPTAQPAV